MNQTGEYRMCGRVTHDSCGDFREPTERDTERSEVARREAEAVRNELVVIQDGSGYYAALKCRADFGCVLFELGGGT